MRASLSFVRPSCVLVLCTVVSGSLFADLREPARHPRFGIRPEKPRVIASSGGLVLESVPAKEALRAWEVLASRRRQGDGGGANVVGLVLAQTRFLDSACDFPTECQGPCNVVLMLWAEDTLNPGGVEIDIDGQVLGTVPGREAVPGANGVTIFGVEAGVHTFGASDISGGTSDELEFPVLDTQPFEDPQDLTCRADGPSDPGTCRLLATWTGPDLRPQAYNARIDGDYPATVGGQQDDLAIVDVPPGSHTVDLTAISAVSGPLDAAREFYLGCTVSTACDVQCADEPCDPPNSLSLCQAAYSNVEENAVRASWRNGESPYGAGVRGYVDGADSGFLPIDPESGSPDLVVVTGIAPGDHEIGVQGVCEDPGLESTVTTRTIRLLPATPHTRPIEGTPSCAHDPEAIPPETTATWTQWDPSVFIDVFVLSGQDLFHVGAIDGDSTSVTVRNTTESDTIVLQFFAAVQGGCYGSDLVGCVTEPPADEFLRGDANANGTVDISDPVYTLNFLFLGGPQPPCRKAADSDDKGDLNLTDAIYTLSFLFQGGPVIKPPYPTAGTDPTPDSLLCGP